MTDTDKASRAVSSLAESASVLGKRTRDTDSAGAPRLEKQQRRPDQYSAFRKAVPPTSRATKPLAQSLGGLQELLKSSAWELSTQELLHRPNLIGGKGMRKKAARLKDPTDNEIKQAFRHFDTDGAGIVGWHDIARVCDELGFKVSAQDVELLTERLAELARGGEPSMLMTSSEFAALVEHFSSFT